MSHNFLIVCKKSAKFLISAGESLPSNAGMVPCPVRIVSYCSAADCDERVKSPTAGIPGREAV